MYTLYIDVSFSISLYFRMQTKRRGCGGEAPAFANFSRGCKVLSLPSNRLPSTCIYIGLSLMTEKSTAQVVVAARHITSKGRRGSSQWLGSKAQKRVLI